MGWLRDNILVVTPYRPHCRYQRMASEAIAEAAQPSHVEASTAMARRVLRKIDYHLIPLLFTSYCLNFMDKTILSSASVFGLREDTVSIKVIELESRTLANGSFSISRVRTTAGCPRSSTLAILAGSTRPLCSLHVFLLRVT